MEVRRKFRSQAKLPKKANYTVAQQEKLRSKLAKVGLGNREILVHSNKRNTMDDGEGGEPSGGVAKKRRLSADKRMAVAEVIVEQGSRRRTRGAALDENNPL
jgi:hypothetical protein